MDVNPLFSEKDMVMEHLRAGWLLYFIEDRPYPAPQRAFLARGDERVLVSYTTFVFLRLNDQLKFTRIVNKEGKPAEEYTFF